MLMPLMWIFSACDGGGEPDNPVTPRPASRTVLVYMVASNNLGTAGYDSADLREMLQAAGNGDIGTGRLLVYHARYSGQPVLKEVTAGGIDTLKIYSNDLQSVDSRRMLEVFDDVERLSPSDSYGLVLWSHASGWLQDGIEDNNDRLLSPLAFGQDNGRKMNLTTLGRTLEQHRFDFVYFDCCYMGAVEVAYELQNATRYIVASPSEIPVDGMPYDKNVKCFFEPVPNLVEAARNTFDLYNSKSGSARTCTISVIDTRGIGRLAELTRQIYSSAALPVPAGYTPQKYMVESRCYHNDLSDYVLSLTADESLQAQWAEALAACVLYENSTPMLWSKLPISTHCGLSTYIFANESESRTKNYHTTSWFRDVASALLPTQ